MTDRTITELERLEQNRREVTTQIIKANVTKRQVEDLLEYLYTVQAGIDLLIDKEKRTREKIGW